MEKIVFLIDHTTHRDQLTLYLGSKYDIASDQLPDTVFQPFDLCIIDFLDLEKFVHELKRRKDQEKPISLPIVALVEKQELEKVQQYRSLVDDVICLPVQPVELRFRIDSLIGLRKLSKQCYGRFRSTKDKTPDLMQLAKNSRDMLYRIALPEGTYEYVSPAVQNVTGYSPDEFYQNPLLIADVVDPEWKDYFERTWENILSGRVPETFEYPIRDKEGNRRWLNQRSVLVRDRNNTPVALEGICSDVTRRRVVEEKLKESIRMNERITKILPIVLYICDLVDMRTIYINREIDLALGYSAEQVTSMRGEFVANVMHPDDLPGFRKHIHELKSLSGGITSEFEYRMKSPLGQWRWFLSKDIVFERDEHGAATKILGAATDITERKKMEEDLRRNQERYRLIQRLAGIGSWEWKRESENVFWSPEAIRMWGYSPDEWRGTREEVTRRIHPEDIDRWQEDVRACLEEGKEHRLDYRIILPDGTVRWMAVFGNAQRDKNGEAFRMAGVVMDITDRKMAEEQQRISQERFQSLLKHTSEGFYLFEMPEPISIDLPVDRQIELLYRGKMVECNDALSRMYGYRSVEEVLGKPLSELHGGTDITENIHFLRTWIQQGYKAAGMVSVEKDRRGDTIWFSNNVVGVIENNRLLRVWGSQTDITAMKKSEEAVIKERNLTNMLMESLPGMFYLVDEQGRFLRWNKTFEELGGYSSEYISKIHPLDLFRGSERELVAQRIALVFESGKADVEASFYTRDGRVIPCYFTGRALELDGRRILVGMGLDISERKRAEDLLRKSEENLRTTLNSIGDAVIATDTQGKITTINPVAAKMTGWESQQAFGRNLTDVFSIVNAQTLKPAENPVLKVLQTGKIVGLANHTMLQSRDGSLYQIADSGAPIRDADNTITGVVLVFRDVTEEYAMQERIADSEERFRVISELTSDFAGSFRVSSNGAMEVEWFLGPIEQITGYSYEELSAHGGIFFIIHPDDKRESRENFEKVLQEGYSYKHDFRVFTKQGEIRWLRNYGTSRRNRKGELRFYMATQNITERKNAVEALQRREAQLRLAMDTARLAYWEYDPSTGLTQHFGFDRLLGVGDHGQHSRSFLFNYIHPDDRALMDEKLEMLQQGGEQFDIEYRLIDPNGKYLWVTNRVQANRAGSGELQRIIGVVFDITLRKLSEQALAEEKERLAITLRCIGDGVITTDTQGRVMMINAAGETLTGWSQKEAMGKPLPEVFPVVEKNSPQKKMNPAQAVLTRKEIVILPDNTFLNARDGSEKSIADSCSPIVEESGNVLGTVLVFRDTTERKNYEANLHASLHQKEVLLQELYHRTKNNMQVISSLLELQAASSANLEVEKIVRESKTRIRTMSLAHEKLYRSKSLSQIQMKEYIDELTQLLMSGYGMAGKQIQLQFDLEPVSLLIDLAIPVGLILSELLSNCFKYAFPDNTGGWIKICLHRKNSHHIKFMVRDNGVGLPPEFDIMKSRTLGVNLVRQIVKHQLHGSFEVKSNGGLGWYITFSDNLYSERV